MCPQALSSPSSRITPLSGAHTGLSYVIPVSQAGQSQDPQRPQGDFLIRIFFFSPPSVRCALSLEGAGFRPGPASLPWQAGWWSGLSLKPCEEGKV